MRRVGRWGVLVAAVGLLRADDPRTGPIVARVAEEAERFLELAPRVVGEERLVHRGVRAGGGKLRPRVGKAATQPTVERVEREIVSEYGFGGLSQAPDALREFRQVLSVDGKPVRAPGKALQEFARTVSAASDVERRRALQDFERLGLVDPASDFGQMILLFRKQSLGGLHFSYKGAFQFGAEAVDIVYWRQRDTGPAASVYRDKEVVKVRMEGEIWARRSDHLPLRITLALPVLEPLGEAQQTIRHEAAIDYFRSTHGVLLPLTIQYQKRAGGQMLVENRAFYSKYRMFTVDVEIRFSGEENPAVPVQPQ